MLTLLGSRAIPTLLFTIMVVVQVEATMQASSVSGGAFHVLSGALWVHVHVLINIRPAPIRRDRAPVGVAVALLSQLTMIAVGLFGADAGAGIRVMVSDRCSFAGLAFSLASVAVLGRCFGILPDVRGLVVRGPYRLVRHPLYLGELTAALGIVVGSRASGRRGRRLAGLPGPPGGADALRGVEPARRVPGVRGVRRPHEAAPPRHRVAQPPPAAVASRPDAIAMRPMRQTGITSAARRPIWPAVNPIIAGPMISPT